MLLIIHYLNARYENVLGYTCTKIYEKRARKKTNEPKNVLS